MGTGVLAADQAEQGPESHGRAAHLELELSGIRSAYGVTRDQELWTKRESRVSQVYSELIKQSKGLSPMAVRPISPDELELRESSLSLRDGLLQKDGAK
jgi:hypothetical protein